MVLRACALMQRDALIMLQASQAAEVRRGLYLDRGVHLVDDALNEVQGQCLHEQELHAVDRQLGALRYGLQGNGPAFCWQPAKSLPYGFVRFFQVIAAWGFADGCKGCVRTVGSSTCKALVVIFFTSSTAHISMQHQKAVRKVAETREDHEMELCGRSWNVGLWLT